MGPSEIGDLGVRRVTIQETLAILGVDQPQEGPLIYHEDETRRYLHLIVPVETAAAVLHMIHRAIALHREMMAQPMGPSPIFMVASHPLGQVADPTSAILTMYELNKWTTIPMPTEKKWIGAIEKDDDLRVLGEAAESGDPPERLSLHDKGYFQPYLDGKLSLEGGIWYHYEEPKKARVRQLRTQVVP